MKEESFKDRLERAFEAWWKSDGSSHTGEAAMKWASAFTLSEAEKEARSTKEEIFCEHDRPCYCAKGMVYPRTVADRLKRMREEL